MRILHAVESYHPAIGGMQEVVKQLSERLVLLGHEVTVVTRYHPDRKTEVINGVKIKAFHIEGNTVRGVTGDEEGYRNYLLKADQEVVTFFAAQQWATDVALPILAQIKPKKVSVPTGYSGLYWPEYKEYFQKMKNWIKEYDMNVYLSDDYRDINFAKENGVEKLLLIPNGAAADEFLPESTIDIRAKFGIPNDHFLLLHVGSYTGWKGHKEAVEIFMRSDLKNATLLMIGNNHQHFRKQFLKNWILGLLWLKKYFTSKQVIFDYVSRKETVAAYKSADLFFFPSNIECSPIVLFEAMASRTPFLATDVGNSVEIAKWSGGGVIMPTEISADGFSHARIDASVKLLNQVYQDKEHRNRLAENGFKSWQNSFSWEVIARKYEQLYQKLVNG